MFQMFILKLVTEMHIYASKYTKLLLVAHALVRPDYAQYFFILGIFLTAEAAFP